MRDDNLTDISSQQAKKVDILSLDLPRLNTGKILYMLHFTVLLFFFFFFLDMATQNLRTIDTGM